MICVLTGAVHGGKTRTATAVVESARAAGRRVMGVLCPGRMQCGVRTSIDAEDLATGKRVRLGRRLVRRLVRRGGGGGGLVSPVPRLREGGRECAGQFSFHSRGLAHGRRALRSAIQMRPPLVVIDEIGPLELSGRGWEPLASELVRQYRSYPEGLLLLVVRQRLLDRIRSKWQLASAPVVQAEAPSAVGSLLALLRV